MGVTATHVLGRNQRFYAERETTFGTYVQPTFRILPLTTSFNKVRERRLRDDVRDTRSSLEQITHMTSVEWSFEGYLIPNGAAGVEPDVGPILETALGKKSFPGGTAVLYEPDSTQGILGSMTLLREFNDVWSELILGAWVETLSIQWGGGDFPRITASGGGRQLIETGSAAATGGTASTATMAAGLELNFTPDASGAEASRVRLLDSTGTNKDDNSGAGFTVASVSSGSITIAGGTWTVPVPGDVVTPYKPSSITVFANGSPLSVIDGKVTIDSLPATGTVPISSGEMTVTNNLSAITDEPFNETVPDYIEGFRNITGSLSLRAREDQIIRLLRRDSFARVNIEATLGTGAGTVVKVQMPQAEIGYEAPSVPQSEEAVLSLPFTALTVDTAKDGELDVTFE